MYVISDEDVRMRELTRMIAFENDPAKLKVLAEELGRILVRKKLLIRKSLPPDKQEASE
jgi:hypothetical protein